MRERPVGGMGRTVVGAREYKGGGSPSANPVLAYKGTLQVITSTLNWTQKQNSNQFNCFMMDKVCSHLLVPEVPSKMAWNKGVVVVGNALKQLIKPFSSVLPGEISVYCTEYSQTSPIPPYIFHLFSF